MQEISVHTYLYYIHGGFQEFIRNFFKCQHHLHFHSLLFSHPPVFFVPMKIDFHIMRNVQYIFCIFHWTTINIDQKKNHYSHFHFNLRNELQFDLLPIEVIYFKLHFSSEFYAFSLYWTLQNKNKSRSIFFPKVNVDQYTAVILKSNIKLKCKVDYEYYGLSSKYN